MVEQSARVKAPRPDCGAGSLRVGRLTKPHGLKGGIKLELYTDSPDARFVPGAVFYLQVPVDSPWFGRTITLRELRWFNQSPVGFFAEVPDRTAAESIVRAILWIDEQTVAATREDDAWYDSELVGMRVCLQTTGASAGQELGTVEEVQHLPAQDLLRVKTPAGDVLVPFVSSIVPEVDEAARVVIVTPPPGLFPGLGEAVSASSTARGGATGAAAAREHIVKAPEAEAN